MRFDSDGAVIVGESRNALAGLLSEMSGQGHEPTLTIRRAGPGDISSLAELFAEMQSHYKQPVDPLTAHRAASLACQDAPTDTFAPRTLIAVGKSEELCGSIVLNVTFPAAELSRSLYIRDLYVASAARRRGVARALLRSAARLTLAEGFSALDWTADAANHPARTMYERAGAQPVGRVFYRLADQRLAMAAR